MARLKTLKLPKGVEIEEISNDNFFHKPSDKAIPTTLAVKDHLNDYVKSEIDKHDQTFMPDGLHRNAIINGNFDIWQRGTSFTNIADRQYVADRWQFRYGAPGSTVSVIRETNTDTEYPSQYMLRATITRTTQPLYFDQWIEDFMSFAGKTVTFTMRVKIPDVADSFDIVIDDGEYASVRIPASTEWQTVSVTKLISKSPVRLRLMIFVYGTVGFTDKNLYINWAQLNVGDKPLPFAPRPIAEELALCQRYWRSSYAIGTPPGTPTSVGVRVYYPNVTRTNYPLDNIDFGNSMRTTPTVTIYSRNDGAPGYVYDYTDQKNVPVKSMIITNNGIHLKIDSEDGHEYGFYWAADAEL